MIKQLRGARPFDLEGALKRFPAQPDDALTRGPVVRALYGEISETTLWAKVKSGEIPRPVDKGLWRIGDLRASLRGKAAA